MDSTSRNLFFHLFEVNPVSKGGGNYGLIFLYRSKNKFFHIYKERYKDFKEDYIFATPISSHSYTNFCVVSDTSSKLVLCVNWIRSFQSRNTSQKMLKIILSCTKPSSRRRMQQSRLTRAVSGRQFTRHDNERLLGKKQIHIEMRGVMRLYKYETTWLKEGL